MSFDHSNYIELSYLGSNSQAYIDTGISGKLGLSFEIEYKYTTLVIYGGIYGNYTSDSDYGYRTILGSSADSLICTTASSFTGANIGTSNTTNVWHTVVASASGSCSLDGTIIGTNIPSMSNSGNIALFNRSITNPNTNRDIGLVVRKFTIDDNGEVVRSMIPAKRRSDGVLGMYDTVTETFYTNAGTGTFTAGDEVQQEITDYKSGILYPRLPSEYTELEYIESSGTQYIDTGIAPTADTKVEIRYMVLEYGLIAFFGSYDSTSRGCFSGYNGSYYINNVSVKSPEIPLATNTKYTDVDYGTTYIKNDTSYTLQVAVAANSMNMYIFARNANGIVDRRCKMRCYGFKVWSDGSTLSINLIPAKRNSDNVLGMYDTVTNTFFTNAGTGSFTAGQEVSQQQLTCYKSVILCPSLPSEYTELEYIQATGTGTIATTVYWIDTGIAGSLDTEIETDITHIFSSGIALLTPISSEKSRTGISISYYSGGPSWATRFGNMSWANQGTIISGTKYHIVFNKDTFTVNGTAHTIGATTQTDTSNIYLMSDVWTQSVSSLVSLRMGVTIIRKNGTVVFNGYPAKRNSDSVIGMYDTVSRTFFANAGTGTFIAGPEQTNPTLQQLACYKSKILFT